MHTREFSRITCVCLTWLPEVAIAAIWERLKERGDTGACRFGIASWNATHIPYENPDDRHRQPLPHALHHHFAPT